MEKKEEFFGRLEFCRRYHLDEMYHRREKQWKVFAAVSTLAIALFSANMFSVRFMPESVIFGIIVCATCIYLIVLMTQWAIKQIGHDKLVAQAHWKAAEFYHKETPLENFSDDDKKRFYADRYEYDDLMRKLQVSLIPVIFVADIVAVISPYIQASVN